MEATLTKNYRVPPELRAINHEAYTPRMFLIGPLHRNKSELQRMEMEKWRYMQDLLYRVEPDKEKYQNNIDEFRKNFRESLAWDKCFKVVSDLEEEARKWYTEDIDLDKQQLVEMLLIDGCFILELVIYKYKPIAIPKEENHSLPIDPTDPLTDNLRIRLTLRNDLMLLENQIPFFVLQNLFNLIPHEKASIGDPVMCLERYISWFFSSVPMLDYNKLNIKDGNYRHLLDMLRHTCYDTFKKSTSMICLDDNDREFTRSATELYKSGIQITRGHKKAVVDLKFNEGKLIIPQVIIDKSSDIFLRNVIAFEQVSCGRHSVSASYVKVMGSLIRSPKDADLLARLGVIIIKSEVKMDASAIFESLSKEVVLEGFCFENLCKEINDYQIPAVWRRRGFQEYFRIKYVEWKESIKDLKQDYFHNRWRSIKSLGSCSVFLLVSLQTFYAIRSDYHRQNH